MQSTVRNTAPETLPAMGDDPLAAPAGPDAPLAAIRWTENIGTYGFSGTSPGVYTRDIVLDGGYNEVRFHGNAMSSQPLTIVIDGRNNDMMFRPYLSGTASTATLTVYGFAGADVFSGVGFLGTSAFHGGLGDDIYSAVSAVELAGEGTDTLYSLQTTVTLPDNVERLIYGYVEFFGSGTSHVFHTGYQVIGSGRGNAQNNEISGYGTQYGMGGDDTLNGGVGNDVLIGGAGNDVLNGGGGSDTASYVDAAAGVFVTLDQAQPMATNDGDGGVDTLNGIENLTGSAFNDILIGDGVANILNGGTGADVLIGLAGNDVLVGGTGAANQMQGGLGDDTYRVSVAGDTLIELAGQGYDTVETTLQSLTLRDNIEALRFTGTGVFAGTGNALDNLVVGGDANDVLTGAGGADVLQGGNGDDILRGGTGNDQLNGGANGSDTADYSTAAAGISASLANSLASNDGDGGSDTFIGVENLTGSAFNDVLIGSGVFGLADNILNGGAGADVLVGLAGNDVLIGGSGAANQMQGGVGNDRYVVSVAGDTLIENAGEGTDTVETALATYTLRANIENLIYTGAGAFNGTGNASNNVLTGGAGADTFSGKAGDDTINGGGGVDTVIMSGVQADYTIQAGAGYVTIGDSVVGRDGIDTLYGVERIRFSDGTVLDITPPAPAPLSQAAPAADLLAAPDTGPQAAPNVQIGTAGRDVLTGGAGADYLIGLGGNDRLFGGAGADSLQGGEGDDEYWVDDAGDTVIEFAGEGRDSINVTASTFTIRANVESMVYMGTGTFTGWGSAAGESFYGGALVDSLYGMAGDDTLDGRGGSDQLYGGAGNDTLNGGEGGGTDTANYSRAAGGVFVTLDQAQPMATNDGDGGVDTLIGIESLIGSNFNDTLIGDGGANGLTGGDGNDYLIGLGGNDLLTGGAGANTLQGGIGDDTYVVLGLTDTLIENAGEGVDTVRTTMQAYTLRANFEGLRFSGTGPFTGTGNASNNGINGAAGNDVLSGLDGDDSLNGDAGDDRLFGGAGADSAFGGQGDDRVEGGAGADRLQGNEGDDIVTGGDGDDSIEGGEENDVLVGGLGNDTLIGGRIGDVDEGGRDMDVVDYSGAGSAVTIRIGPGTRTSSDGDGGTDTLINIEGVIGSAFNDTLVGDRWSEVLNGGAGNDLLLGFDGGDTLIGGAGTNTMQGGDGWDTYVVSSASDTLVELADQGVDTVQTTLSSYTLKTNFEDLMYIGAGAFTGVGNAANNNLTGGAGNDTFTGLGGMDIYRGGDGIDTFVLSGTAADYVIARQWNGAVMVLDKVAGRDGQDTLYDDVERIRFSDGSVLDLTTLTPPASTLSSTVEKLLETLSATPVTGGHGDTPLTLHDAGSAWDSY